MKENFYSKIIFPLLGKETGTGFALENDTLKIKRWNYYVYNIILQRFHWGLTIY